MGQPLYYLFQNDLEKVSGREALDRQYGYSHFCEILKEYSEAPQALDVLEFSIFNRILLDHFPKPNQDDRVDYYRTHLVGRLVQKRYAAGSETLKDPKRCVEFVICLAEYLNQHLPKMKLLPPRGIVPVLTEGKIEAAFDCIKQAMGEWGERTSPGTFQADAIMHDMMISLLRLLEEHEDKTIGLSRSRERLLSAAIKGIIIFFLNYEGPEFGQAIAEWSTKSSSDGQRDALKWIKEAVMQSREFEKGLTHCLTIYAGATDRGVLDNALTTITELLAEQDPRTRTRTMFRLLTHQEEQVRAAASRILVIQRDVFPGQELEMLEDIITHDPSERVRAALAQEKAKLALDQRSRLG